MAQKRSTLWRHPDHDPAVVPTPGTRDPLTDAAVRALVPGTTPIETRDGGAPGLIVTVLPSGRKQWSVRYRHAGKQMRLILGDYPGLTLAKARRAAEQARVDVRSGRDLVAERKARKAKPKDTIETLIDDYLTKYARPRKKTAAEDERVLMRYVLPVWKGRSVRTLTRSDVRDVLDRIVDRGAGIMANRTLEVIRRMLNWAVEEGDLDASPASHVKKPAVEQSRERVLTDDELRALWRCLSHFPATEQKQAPGRKRATSDTVDPFCPLSPSLAAVQKVRLLTAQRGGEVIRMKWTDLDRAAKVWTIPSEDSKNGRPHRVPLTDSAITIINGQPRREREDGDTSPDYVFTTRGGALPVDRVRKAGAALSRALGFEMRSHDLRRTAATRMAAAGVPREHISRVLNHTPAGPVSTRVYDRHDYDREKRIALDTWDRALSQILHSEPVSNVTPITVQRGSR